MWRASQADFAVLFKRLCGQLGVESVGYSPASLRAGGAVGAFVRGEASVADLRFRGRWDSDKTLSHYLQEGIAALAVCAIPSESQIRCMELSRLCEPLLAAVPENL